MWYSEGVRIRDAGRGGLRFCVTQFGDREIGGKSHGHPCSHMTVTVSRFSSGPIGIAVTCIQVSCLAPWQHLGFQVFLSILS